jgi:hypothetical protein
MTAAELPPIADLPPICGTAQLAIDRLHAEAAEHAASRRNEAEQAEGIDFFKVPNRPESSPHPSRGATPAPVYRPLTSGNDRSAICGQLARRREAEQAEGIDFFQGARE